MSEKRGSTGKNKWNEEEKARWEGDMREKELDQIKKKN